MASPSLPSPTSCLLLSSLIQQGGLALRPSGGLVASSMASGGGGGFSSHKDYFAHKQQNLARQFSNRSEAPKLSNALEHVVAHLNGYTATPKDELVRTLTDHGGQYSQYLTRFVTHLITDKLPTAHVRRYENNKQRSRNVVTVQWLLDSAQHKKKMPESKYLPKEFRHPHQRLIPFDANPSGQVINHHPGEQHPKNENYFVSVRARQPGFDPCAMTFPRGLIPLGDTEWITNTAVTESRVSEEWMQAFQTFRSQVAVGVAKTVSLSRLASSIHAREEGPGEAALWVRDRSLEEKIVHQRPLFVLLPDISLSEIEVLNAAGLFTCGDVINDMDNSGTDGVASLIFGGRFKYIRALANCAAPIQPDNCDDMCIPPPPTTNSGFGLESMSALDADRQKGWECLQCTYFNPADFLACAMCGALVPVPAPEPPSPPRHRVARSADDYKRKRRKISGGSEKLNDRSASNRSGRKTVRSPFEMASSPTPSRSRQRFDTSPIRLSTASFDDVEDEVECAKEIMCDDWREIEPWLSDWLRNETKPDATPLILAAEAMIKGWCTEALGHMTRLLEKECSHHVAWHHTLRNYVVRVDELIRERYGGLFKPCENMRNQFKVS